MASTNGRAEGGRFAPGVSGNPGGRPKRLLAIETALHEAHDAAKVLAVIDRLHGMAVRGNVQAARLYLDRVVGPVRDEALIDAKAQQRLEQMIADARAQRAAHEPDAEGSTPDGR